MGKETRNNVTKEFRSFELKCDNDVTGIKSKRLKGKQGNDKTFQSGKAWSNKQVTKTDRNSRSIGRRKTIKREKKNRSVREEVKEREESCS